MSRLSFVLISLPGLALASLAYGLGSTLVTAGVLVGILGLWFYNERVRSR